MKTITLSLAFAALALPAFAQDHSGHGATDAAPAVDLPAICLADAGTVHEMPSMQMPGDEAHTALMAGMDKMNADMMAGGTAKDIDVAFVCSMIPHHRGAIDMAKAELAHGDDEWAKTMAQKVIDAQEQEIADMLAWLEGQK
ncbi:MAG TPA: DUF305 domain-containing protein [Devosia sp.]